MRFHAYIDATFDADNIDEAIARLAIHILEPLIGMDEDMPQYGWLGEIDIHPADLPDPELN